MGRRQRLLFAPLLAGKCDIEINDKLICSERRALASRNGDPRELPVVGRARARAKADTVRTSVSSSLLGALRLAVASRAPTGGQFRAGANRSEFIISFLIIIFSELLLKPLSRRRATSLHALAPRSAHALAGWA